MDGYSADYKEVTANGHKLIYKLKGHDQKEVGLIFVRTPFNDNNSFYHCLLELLKSNHYTKAIDKTIKDVITLK